MTTSAILARVSAWLESGWSLNLTSSCMSAPPAPRPETTVSEEVPPTLSPGNPVFQSQLLALAVPIRLPNEKLSLPQFLAVLRVLSQRQDLGIPLDPNKCLQAHLLEEQWTGSGEASCAVCSRKLAEHVRILACRICDYNQCIPCHDKLRNLYHEIDGGKEELIVVRAFVSRNVLRRSLVCLERAFYAVEEDAEELLQQRLQMHDLARRMLEPQTTIFALCTAVTVRRTSEHSCFRYMPVEILRLLCAMLGWDACWNL